MLIGKQTNISAEELQSWLQASVKAKSAMTLTLGTTTIAQVGYIVDDDDRIAKDLWNSLEKLYDTSTTQAIINIQQQLEALQIVDGQNWENTRRSSANFSQFLQCTTLQ